MKKKDERKKDVLIDFDSKRLNAVINSIGAKFYVNRSQFYSKSEELLDMI